MVGSNSRYDLYFVSSIDVHNMDGIDIGYCYKSLFSSYKHKDSSNRLFTRELVPLLPHLYNLIF